MGMGVSLKYIVTKISDRYADTLLATDAAQMFRQPDVTAHDCQSILCRKFERIDVPETFTRLGTILIFNEQVISNFRSGLNKNQFQIRKFGRNGIYSKKIFRFFPSILFFVTTSN